MGSGVDAEIGLRERMVPALVSAVSQEGKLRLFAGTVTGVCQSTDLGRSWLDIAAGQDGPKCVLSFGLSPFYETDRTIFAGTLDGLWRSSDDGKHWAHLLVGDCVNAVVCSTSREEQYDLIVGTDKDGVLRSSDAGRNWTSANPGLLDLSVLSLAAAPDPLSMQLLFAGTTSGLYSSKNAGKSWIPIDLPIESAAVECAALIPFQSMQSVVLVGTEADGLFRSNDLGRNWETVTAFDSVGITAIASAQSSTGQHFIACSTGAGLAVSSDMGATWRFTGSFEEPALSLLAFEEASRVVLLAGLAQSGVVRSVDEGATWERTELRRH